MSTDLPRPAPDLPTERGAVVLASRLAAVDYDPPVALTHLPESEDDPKPWCSLDEGRTWRRWYRPDQIESWTLARIVPADEPEKGETRG